MRPETRDARSGDVNMTVRDWGGAVGLEARAPTLVTVKDLVAGSGLRFEDRGVQALKDVPGEWRLFAVEREDTAA